MFEHFTDVGKTIPMPEGTNKKVIALAQIYFAIQTIKEREYSS